MSQHDVRTKLVARHDELLRQIGKMEADIRHVTNPVETDSQERSVQLENDDVLSALDEAGRTEIAQLERALRRLDDGTYGICARCEEPISAPRLAALPIAEHCIGCASATD